MKNKRNVSHSLIIKLPITILLIISAQFLFGCHKPVKEQNKSNASASSLSLHDGDEKYIKIDTQESVVTWKGSSVDGAHTGYVYISKGELMIENSQLMGGTVEIDMNTIEDETHGHNSGLIKHLKDPDFFEVEKFPVSTIVITNITSIKGEDKKITGNLTIKGITHPVSFLAKIDVKEDVFKASGKLVIDRTLWDVRYNSGKFFDNLKDQAISDSIEFNIKIIAKQ